MLKKNTKITLVLGLLFLAALVVSGCSETNKQLPPDDLKRRVAIMTDKSLTDAQREDKLTDLDNSENSTPTLPIIISVLVVLSVVFVIRAVMQRGAEQKEEFRLEQAKAQKIAEAKAAYEASKAPKPVATRSSRTASAASISVDVPPDAIAYEEVQVVKVAASQSAVNALAPAERGVSYFTSRPAPLSSLVEITIMVGDRFRLVWATPEEADAVDAGNVPLVRAFTHRRKTLPWYEWAGYDPYIHYWPAVSHDWLWMGGKVTASWLNVDKANPAMPGYNGNKTTTRIDWDRAIRARQPDEPVERILAKCNSESSYRQLKRRKTPKPIRSIVRGRHVPPLAIPSRPLKLHKRPAKRDMSNRHVYLEF